MFDYRIDTVNAMQYAQIQKQATQVCKDIFFEVLFSRSSSALFTEQDYCRLKAYILLYELMKEKFSVAVLPEIDRTERGKPFFTTQTECYFSISHTKGAAAAIISDLPIGIDLERKRKAEVKLLNRTASPQEREQVLKSANQDLAFTALWTAKESVAKANGGGLSLGLMKIKIDINEKSAVVENCSYCLTALHAPLGYTAMAAEQVAK